MYNASFCACETGFSGRKQTERNLPRDWDQSVGKTVFTGGIVRYLGLVSAGYETNSSLNVVVVAQLAMFGRSLRLAVVILALPHNWGL